MAPDRQPIDRIAAQLIAMAASLCGGDFQKVRSRMACSEAEFEAYRTARKTPTNPQFDRVVALIVEEQAKVIARNRALLDEVRAKRASFSEE